jgi:hypothetical protein
MKRGTRLHKSFKTEWSLHERHVSTLKERYILSTECIYKFRMILTMDINIFQHNIQLVVFLMETVCVYCDAEIKFHIGYYSDEFHVSRG